MNSFWSGFEKCAAGSGHVDRFLKSLSKSGKGKKAISEAHSKVRALDLKNQFRGLAHSRETALVTATEAAEKTKKAGGFASTKI